MSVQAMAWAIQQREVQDPVGRLVLLCLANYAGADGRNAFPSISRMAFDTCLSARAVQYQLRKLQKSIVIRRGDQSIVGAYIKRGDRRPTCYDLIFERGATDAPRIVTGCTATTDGVHVDASRGARGAPDPSLKSEGEPKRVVTTAEKQEFKARLRAQALASGLAQRKRA